MSLLSIIGLFFLFKLDHNGHPTNEFSDMGGYFDLAPVDSSEDVRRNIVLELTKNSAHVNQYMTLLNTNKSSESLIVTPILYVYKLKKIEGIWKISYREINLDRPLDLEIKP